MFVCVCSFGVFYGNRVSKHVMCGRVMFMRSKAHIIRQEDYDEAGVSRKLFFTMLCDKSDEDERVHGKDDNDAERRRKKKRRRTRRDMDVMRKRGPKVQFA